MQCRRPAGEMNVNRQNLGEGEPREGSKGNAFQGREMFR